MMVEDALIAGSLGWAMFRKGGVLLLLESPAAAPRVPQPNEIYWFRKIAKEIVPVDSLRTRVSIRTVRSRLSEETRFFNAMDGLLVGMDPDMSESIRTVSIARAQTELAARGATFRWRVAARFLVPPEEGWDPASAVVLARTTRAPFCVQFYRALASGAVARIFQDITLVVQQKIESGSIAAIARSKFVESGVIAELALAEVTERRPDLGRLQQCVIPYDVEGVTDILQSLVDKLEARRPEMANPRLPNTVPLLGVVRPVTSVAQACFRSTRALLPELKLGAKVQLSERGFLFRRSLWSTSIKADLANSVALIVAQLLTFARILSSFLQAVVLLCVTVGLLYFINPPILSLRERFSEWYYRSVHLSELSSRTMGAFIKGDREKLPWELSNPIRNLDASPLAWRENVLQFNDVSQIKRAHLGDSTMSIAVKGDEITIAYDRPGNKVKTEGVKTGMVFFKGTLTNNSMIAGTLYYSKIECGGSAGVNFVERDAIGGINLQKNKMTLIDSPNAPNGPCEGAKHDEPMQFELSLFQ